MLAVDDVALIEDAEDVVEELEVEELEERGGIERLR